MTVPHYARRRTEEEVEEIGRKLFIWVTENIKAERNFLLGDFAFQNGFRPGLMIIWARKHDGFREAYLLAKEWQEHMISKGAIHGIINSRFAQFHLGCNHGWKMASTEDPGQALKTAFDGWVNKHLGTGEKKDEPEYSFGAGL